MNKISLVVITLLTLSGFACGPKLSKGKYVKAMSDLGCKGYSELAPQGKEMLQKDGITQDDITQFRRKADVDTMREVAMEIATNVAKCHNVMTPQP